MNKVVHTQVAIIGGGIVGSSIAYYVAKAGLDCVMLEKGEIASGTSSRCDGNILAIDKDPGFDSQMSLKSQELVNQLNAELDIPFEYRCLGSILVCENEAEMEAAALWVQRQRAVGLPFRLLDRVDIREESPYFADDLLGGLECASDSTVNPYLLTYSLLDKARKYGAQVYKHSEVIEVRVEREGLFVIKTKSGTFTAEKVINAGGVWAPIIGRMLELDIPIKPRKGHLIVASRAEPIGLRKVMEFGYLISKFGGERQVDVETEQYGVALVFEPTESQNFLLGSSRQFAGFNTRVEYPVIQCMARRVLRFYPKVNDFKLIRTYAGLRPWTADHLPIVSAVEEIPGFYIAAGHEGDGISLAAVTGKLIQELITGEENTIIPPGPLRYDRFRERMNKHAGEKSILHH